MLPFSHEIEAYTHDRPHPDLITGWMAVLSQKTKKFVIAMDPILPGFRVFNMSHIIRRRVCS